MWLFTAIAVVSVTSLLIGFLTPFSGAVVGLLSVGMALSWFSVPASGLVHGGLAAAHMAAMAAATVFLGPGWFSLDAYFYGRREIIIPGGRQ
jgi:hypothetical protein